MHARKRRRLETEPLESRELLAGDLPIVSTSDVLNWGKGFVPVEGAYSEVTRMDHGVSIELQTAELSPGAYTMWLVLFNNPEHCHDACGPDDLPNPATEATVHYLDGQIVNEDGKAAFALELEEGDVTGVQEVFADFAGMRFSELPGADNGLIDSTKAELHMILQHHGALSDDLSIRDEQLTKYLAAATQSASTCKVPDIFPRGPQGTLMATPK